MKTAQEITPWQRQQTQQREQAFLEQIKAQGVQVTQLSTQQRQALANKTTQLIEKFEPIIGTDIISYTQSYLNQKYALAEGNKLAIGLNADLSSESKNAGLAIKRGLELAIADINAQGGLLGKELVLLPMDHRTLASRGQENLRTLADRPDVIAVVGGVHSAVVMAERPLINQFKIPYLVPWATAAEITEADGHHRFIFRLSINDHIGAQKMADFTATHFQKPAIIVENSIWGRSNLQYLKTHLTAQSIDIVLESTFNRGQKNFEALAELIKEKEADSLILVANSEESANLVKTLYRHQSLLPIISHWGIAGGNFFDQINSVLPELNLHLLQTFSFEFYHPPQQHQLHLHYVQRYGKIHAPYAANGVAQAYDLIQLLALAVNQAQDTDSEAIRNALENLPPYQGVLKTYAPAFNAQRHDALNENDIFMVNVTDQGRLVKVDKKEAP